MKYTPTIGLEIHAELKTLTKMFCVSKNDPDEKTPNSNICPVCMAYPGTLPVINKKAVESIIKIGLALGGEIADKTNFDRKNYFYPDIPKGYQISQYKDPIVTGGSLNGISITRVHLEEDTARSIHDANNTNSLIDFNRAGVPLMELVTEPVIKSSKDASNFARELQLLLRYLGVSEANMEKGEMRVEANVSIGDGKKLGTKVELKNLNSFKIVEKAINYEIKRQEEVLEKGEKVIQETRGWDENNGITFSQRKKEESHDYRYFPDPDLPIMKLDEMFNIDDIKLPELPTQKKERYKRDFGIKDEDIDIYILNPALASFFESVCNYLSGDKDTIRIASNYITSDIVGILKTKSVSVSKDKIGKLDARDFADLTKMAKEGEISSRGLKDVLPKVLSEDKTVRELAKEHNLYQKSNEKELKKLVEKVISENSSVMEEYRNGKDKSIGFLIGQAMAKSGGSANPQILEKLFKEYK